MPYKDPEVERAYRAAYYADHRKEKLAYQAAYNAEHREEVKANHAAYDATHLEEKAANNRAYLKTDYGYAVHRAESNRHGAIRRDAVIDPTFKDAELARILIDSDHCAMCGEPVELRDRRIDHRKTIASGGEHTASNVQILGKPCERQKTLAEKALRDKLRSGTTKQEFCLAA
jgi:5-methylcytosine-specific restriction endonuclease McrA